MTWPLVSRARLELALHNLAEMRALHRADVDYYRNRLDALADKYHALAGANPATATTMAAVVQPVVLEEPDVPPDEVLLAMQQISPVRDKTYEANWQHWERNKEQARLHPKDFAQDILQGVVAG